MKFEGSPELEDLLSILADWASPATSAKFYLFGSRVRGDHRPESDVDISIKWDVPADSQTTDWWTIQNGELFKSIESKLPGRLHFPEPNETEFHARVQSGEIVRTRGNIHCVWMKGK